VSDRRHFALDFRHLPPQDESRSPMSTERRAGFAAAGKLCRNRGHGFRGYAGSLLLRPVRLLAALYGSDRSPGQRGLLHPGFRRIGHPSTGYDYNSDWTPLLAGLSPAGMAASLAALVRPYGPPAQTRSVEGAVGKIGGWECVARNGNHSPCSARHG
jgi:hypothetical protein